MLMSVAEYEEYQRKACQSVTIPARKSVGYRTPSQIRGRGRHRRLPGEMTKPEQAYHANLTLQVQAGSILNFRYEALKLRLADRTWYTPDFMVQRLDGTLELHEIKGCTKNKITGAFKAYAEEDALVKLKVAAEVWFEYRFCLCYQLPKSAGGEWEVIEV